MTSIRLFTPASRRAMAATSTNGRTPTIKHSTTLKRMSRLISLLTIAGLAIVALPGCAKRSKTVSVEGTITFEGKPVTDGIINFLPPKGRPLGGGINSDGTYSVALPPGEYQVRIDAPAQLPAGYKARHFRSSAHHWCR
jgi:hypothetical protein